MHHKLLKWSSYYASLLQALLNWWWTLLQGNAAFKGRQWNKAVNYYTEAIKLNERNATFYCNRAAAYLELGWYDMIFDFLVDALHFVISWLRLGVGRFLNMIFDFLVDDLHFVISCLRLLGGILLF